MKRLFKTIIWLFFLGIILYAAALFVFMGGVAQFSDDVPAEKVFALRFGEKTAEVDVIAGGGESWLESDLWLVFRHQPPILPEFVQKMQNCSDGKRVQHYFRGKLELKGTMLAVPEDMRCMEIVNPNDPTLAGRWLILDEAGGLHFYREWSRGR